MIPGATGIGFANPFDRTGKLPLGLMKKMLVGGPALSGRLRYALQKAIFND
jgi:hypothetical protein